MRAGTSGFLLQDVRPEQLADAGRVVAAERPTSRARDHSPLVEQFVRRAATSCRSERMVGKGSIITRRTGYPRQALREHTSDRCCLARQPANYTGTTQALPGRSPS